MGKYKKRKDGRYASQILIGYHDDGRRKVKTIYGRTIAELEHKLLEFKSLMNKGIILDPKEYTLQTWADEWFEAYGTKGLKPISIRSKRSDLKHITTSPVSTIPMDKIRTHHLQQLINDIYDTAPSKAQKAYSLLVNIFDVAIKNNIVLKNFAKDIELPKYTAKQKRALTSEEQNYFRNCDFELQERVFVDLALDCGLRKGEILALNLADFDLKNETVDIHKTYDITKRVISPTPKTDCGNRTVPVPKGTLENVRKLAIENGGMQLFIKNGRPLSGKAFTNMWNGIVYKVLEDMDGNESIISGIRTEDITPHFLRHTYATNLFYAGIDIKAAQYLLGHANVETTLKIYTHLQLDNEDIKTRLFSYINDMGKSHKSVKTL